MSPLPAVRLPLGTTTASSLLPRPHRQQQQQKQQQRQQQLHHFNNSAFAAADQGQSNARRARNQLEPRFLEPWSILRKDFMALEDSAVVRTTPHPTPTCAAATLGVTTPQHPTSAAAVAPDVSPAAAASAMSKGASAIAAAAGAAAAAANPAVRGFPRPETKHRAVVKAGALDQGDVDRRFSVLDNLIESSGGCAILDGGFATELERRGADLNDPLWSAKCLLDEEASALVREVHVDYYKAGADIGISASYQATIQGFVARGFTEEHGEELLARSVELVKEARDQFWEEYQKQQQEQKQKQSSRSSNGLKPFSGIRIRQRPLVAASVGSYGAYLADGSEYSGEYGPDMTLDKLVDFHRRRVLALAAAGPDILAFETIPNLIEAEAFVRILEEDDVAVPAWLCFNSKDGRNVVRGDAFEDCVAVGEASRKVVAVGINCTPPRFIHSLIDIIRNVTSKPIVVYPNSGEAWDGERKVWVESTGATDDDFTSYAPDWRAAGAKVLGGCCRTTPHTISCICHALKDHDEQVEQQQQQQKQPQPQP